MKTELPLSINFLFISRWGESLDIINTIKLEGHHVKMFIDDKASKEIGYGFVTKVSQWEKHIDWADVIVFDYTG